jgi:hypothetical protein
MSKGRNKRDKGQARWARKEQRKEAEKQRKRDMLHSLFRRMGI